MAVVVEVSGVYRCVENPLTFTVHADGSVSGPTRYRREWWETPDDGKTWVRRTDTRGTEDIKARLRERHARETA